MAEKLTTFEADGQQDEVTFLETNEVKPGVSCDVYSIEGDDNRDLAVITMASGSKTPLQRVLEGEKTVEGYISGEGDLTITSATGVEATFTFPGSITAVEVNIGDTMRWSAKTELVFYETCVPPYQDGRFETVEP